MRYNVKQHACQLSPRSDRPPLRIAVDGHVGASLMVMRQEAVSFRIGVLWPLENAIYFGEISSFDPSSGMHSVRCTSIEACYASARK